MDESEMVDATAQLIQKSSFLNELYEPCGSTMKLFVGFLKNKPISYRERLCTNSI